MLHLVNRFVALPAEDHILIGVVMLFELVAAPRLTHGCFFDLPCKLYFHACFFIAAAMSLNSFFLALFSAKAAALSPIFAACASSCSSVMPSLRYWLASGVNQRLAFAMKQRVFFQKKLAEMPYCMSIPPAFTAH